MRRVTTPVPKRHGDLGDRVYRQLKALILQYEFRPGHRLVTHDLAQRFEVSRTPVNQALARLEHEGYVTSRPNRGFQIAEIEPREADELFGLREALEAYAVELAAQRQTPAQMRDLRARMQDYAALGRQPLSRQKFLLDRALHLAIADMAGNARLRDMLDQVFERIILKRKIEGLVSRGMVTVREHQDIYDAISARDATLAVRRMREHIRHSCGNLLRHLEGRRDLFGSANDGAR